MSDAGYARLHRSLLGHPAFRNEGEAMAFAWMIMRASWRQSRVRYKGIPLKLERGQLAVSIRDFAKSHDRPKGWVERLFARLKSETMIETRTETGITIITICKYNHYQAEQDRDGTLIETGSEKVTGQRQDTEQRREEKKDTIPNGMGVPPVDIVKVIFDLGVSMLTASGHDLRSARSIIGRWRKDHSDSRVLEALTDCQSRRISNPVEWMPKRLTANGSGGNFSDLHEQSQRYAEFRARA